MPVKTYARTSKNGVVAFGASLALLSFVDRAAISQAAPLISRDLRLTPFEMGLVFSAFGLTYAAGEIPSGWLCDRFGVRRLLTRVVLLWSLFTAATGLAWNFGWLIVARLLFGAGESGCFPGLARMFRSRLTPEERNSAEGIKAASARWGAAITPAVMAGLFSFLNWRHVFVLFGAIGVVWAAAFGHWYRDSPARETPQRHLERGVWKPLLKSRTAWLLGLQWFCHYYGFYFYITWLPTYLYQARGIDLRHNALAAGTPLFAAGLGSLAGGWALSALTRRLNSTPRARKLFGYAAYGGAGALLLGFTFLADPWLAMIALSLSSFAAEFSGPVSWTTAMDIGGENVGVVSGFMNMLGHFGGSVAPAVTGVLLTWSGNAWNVAFVVSALIYGAGGLCWMFIDPVTPIIPEAPGTAAASIGVQAAEATSTVQ
jgi:MFS family permease